MKPVNVLVTSEIGDECVQLISAIDGVKVDDVSGLLRRELKGDAVAGEKFDASLSDAEIIYGLRLPQDVIKKAPNLRWVQVMSAGVERFLDADMRESPVVLTNVSGIHAIPISEFVIGLMLMFVKQSPVCLELKQRRKWERISPVVLANKTVGIVGLGSIGQQVARLARAFGMKVIATRRSSTEGARARNVDLMLPPFRLTDLLRQSDFVVLSVPFTSETNMLIGEAELRSMKPTARIINVARGGIVDEQALIRALQAGWIAGAGLDVFATEPLPSDSPLWTLPNVILSPHVSGTREDYVLAATRVFVDNLHRYLEGKRLVNVVDKTRGY
jgi:D-2-hydroxyacid dehydrogenase (NADP+)